MVQEDKMIEYVKFKSLKVPLSAFPVAFTADHLYVFNVLHLYL